MYSREYTHRVAGTWIDELDGRPLVSPDFPHIRISPTESLVVVPSPDGQEEAVDEITNEQMLLVRISDGHGRSFELHVKSNDIEYTQDVYIVDEFGNPYFSVNYKGNDVMDPMVQRSETNPSGFRYLGLQESDSLVRIVRVSEVLRSLGIDTDFVTDIFLPSELPWNGEMVPVSTFRMNLKIRAYEDAKREAREDEEHKVMPEDLPVIAAHLDTAKFIVTTRHVRINERIDDFGQVENLEDFIQLLGSVFDVVQRIETLRKQQVPDYQPRGYTETDPADREEYFLEALPQWALINIATLHDAGLLHKYLHLGNISALGGIPDGDSVVGPKLGLGDPENSVEAVAKEAREVIFSYYSLLLRLAEKGLLPLATIHVQGDDGEGREYSPEGMKTFATMHILYLRYRTTGHFEILKEFANTHKHFDRLLFKALSSSEDTAEYLLDKMKSQIGWEYSASERIESLYRRVMGWGIEITDEMTLEDAFRTYISLADSESVATKLVNAVLYVLARDIVTHHRGALHALRDTHGKVFATSIFYLYIQREFERSADTLARLFHLDERV